MNELDDEDVVRYWIYPTVADGISNLGQEETLCRCYASISGFTKTFIWHHQPFSLRIKTSEDGSWYLEGSVVYGNNIEDEWFVISLLFHITKTLPHLVARVTDNDGEILLIEAASCIPRWASEPSQAEGRVYICRGRVHLVPVADTPGQITPAPRSAPPPSLAQLVNSYPHLTLASESVQAAIIDRLGDYPGDTTKNDHHVRAVLPESAAAVFHNCKGALAGSVHAICGRDPIDTRRTRSMEKIRSKGGKIYTVKMSKCLYAMVSGLTVQPYKSSGWSLPLQNDGGYKAAHLGYKLSLGLEILLSRERQVGKSGDEAGFGSFEGKLRDVGYFRGQMEGSRLYKELRDSAKSFYLSSLGDQSDEGGVSEVYSKFMEGMLEPAVDGWLLASRGKEDSEEWLNVTPESLDDMLAARFGLAKSNNGKEADKIPEEVDKFLRRVSDMAGVEMKGDQEEGINFNPDELVNSMKKLLSEEVGDDDHHFCVDSDEDCCVDSDKDWEPDHVMEDYMERLDDEVRKEGVGQDMPDINSPLDVDSSVLANLLASYQAQGGLAGPTASLLHPLGINPREKAEK